MKTSLKKELYNYCERNYQRKVTLLQSAKDGWEKSGKRPKNAKGNDLISHLEKEVGKYHDGLIELS